uniref:Uncharacterized protein n=1 Tax=Physcomitrium patens TaxID=3218 RepID=A0A2K1KAJ6_PHYPA|nr:hypothetical protein PHYPA_009986 [Physcomitrium patens]
MLMQCYFLIQLAFAMTLAIMIFGVHLHDYVFSHSELYVTLS